MTRTVGRRARSLVALVRSPADVWLASTVVGWMISLPLLKRLLPLSALVRLMWRPAGTSPTRSVDRIASIVGRIGRLSGGNCLNRSLIAYRLLSRVGADPILVLGLGREGEVIGHTWVSVHGRPLLEDPRSLAKYTHVVSFGANGRSLDDAARA